MSHRSDSGRVAFPVVSADQWELQLDAPDSSVAGVSIAALATAFAIDRFKIAIDMGRCSALLAAQETVLLTHCHSDHVAGLIAWLSAHTRRHRGRPTRVVVPAERRAELLAALEIWPDLDGVRRRVDLDEAMVSASPGTTIELGGGGSARAFAVRHNTAALGWALSRVDTPRPAMVFAGDGTVEPFRDDPGLLDADIAVVDCSFIDPGTRVAARLSGHGHLMDWIELLPELECGALVLAHLPPETTADRILERLPEELPGTATVVPWVAGPRYPAG
jgi:ribonuclease Z